MDDLLKDAIADAKAVRETALENAKIALEEAFTPRLQSMLSKKIQSEVEEEEAEEGMHDEDEEMEEEEAEEGMHDEDEDMGEGEHEEGYHEDEEMEEEEPSIDIDVTGDEPDVSVDDDDEEMGEDDVIEINGTKYAPVVSEEEAEEDVEEDEVEEGDLDLEAVIKELESEIEEEVEEDEDAEEGMHENDVSSGIGDADNKVNDDANDSTETGAQGPEGEGSDEEAGNEGEEETVSEDIDLEEILKALSEEEEADEDVEEAAKLRADLDEHRNVVKYLRSKLNEVNLLNAKLLFTNKLFRSHGLSNEQKMKVVETFDRATNLREVKLVYSTLAESFGSTKTKTDIKESKGSASKAVASTKSKKQEVIAEGHEMRDRFKKLAGIL